MKVTHLLDIGYQLKKSYTQCIVPIAEKHGISKIALDVLLFLYNNPEWDTANDVVRIRGIAKSYVSKSIDELVTKGFIKSELDSKDRRKNHLKLLPPSLVVVREGVEAQEKFAMELIKGVTKEEKESFERIVGKVQNNLKGGK